MIPRLSHEITPQILIVGQVVRKSAAHCGAVDIPYFHPAINFALPDIIQNKGNDEDISSLESVARVHCISFHFNGNATVGYVSDVQLPSSFKRWLKYVPFKSTALR